MFRSRRRTPLAVVAATALLSAVMVVMSQPSGADASKSFTTLCAGSDPDSVAFMKILSPTGTLAAPLTVSTKAPATLEPEQADTAISVTWALNLSQDLVDKAAGFGISSLGVKNVKMDLKVSGPTATTLVPGAPADRSITLTKGQPFSLSLGPFPATLTEIGGGGVIKLASDKVSFSIDPGTIPGVGAVGIINLSCTTNVTVATIPIVVPGSPVVTQPIDVNGVAGTDVTVDVLGQFVKNGVTKQGVEMPVDPSTLKVIDGPGAVSDGKVVIPSPAAGASADTTFEVCAGEVEIEPAFEGSTETQRIEVNVDPNALALRRPIGLMFQFGEDSSTKPLWFAKHTLFTNAFLIDQYITDPAPAGWADPADENGDTAWTKKSGDYFLTAFAFPTPEMVQSALESVPGIGAGNVEVVLVEQTAAKATWDIKFKGALANKDVAQISVAGNGFWSILPNEWLGGLTGLLSGGDGEGEGGEGGGGGLPEVEIPDGLTAKQYAEQLRAEADALFAQLKFAEGFDKLTQSILVSLKDPDTIKELLALVTSIFQPVPDFTTPENGEDPRPANIQKLCSQGVITVTTPPSDVSPETTVAGDQGGAPAPAPAALGITG